MVVHRRLTGKYKPSSPVKIAAKNGYCLRHTETRLKHVNSRPDITDSPDEEVPEKETILVKPENTVPPDLVKVETILPTCHQLEDSKPVVVEPVVLVPTTRQSLDRKRVVTPTTSVKHTRRKATTRSPSMSGLLAYCILVALSLASI